jgi:two-component system, NtrC family, response regulator GlrR
VFFPDSLALMPPVLVPMNSNSQSSLQDHVGDSIDGAATRDWLLGVDRERRNAIQRNGSPVRTWAKPDNTARLSVAGLLVDMPSFVEAQGQFVRNYLRHALTVSGGNVSWAARLARRNRTSFHRLLVKYKLVPADFRSRRQ